MQHMQLAQPRGLGVQDPSAPRIYRWHREPFSKGVTVAVSDYQAMAFRLVDLVVVFNFASGSTFDMIQLGMFMCVRYPSSQSAGGKIGFESLIPQLSVV